MPHRSPLVMCCALALGACAGDRTVQTLDGRAYPDGVAQREVLDVQVAQDQQSVRLTNTTPRPLGPGWLWLNAWYSAPIDEVVVGASLVVPLDAFRDEFGQTPRSGGFWAARSAVKVVHVQIERINPATGERQFSGLVVVGVDER